MAASWHLLQLSWRGGVAAGAHTVEWLTRRPHSASLQSLHDVAWLTLVATGCMISAVCAWVG